MDKKYLLYPGYVVSETDGKRHYITAKALMKLYNVPPEECVVWIPYRPYPNQDKLIALHPMANGKYKDMQKQEEEENGKENNDNNGSMEISVRFLSR
ncbi:MAG: hypothetical protein BWX46_00519 [Candidatus Cloacimonetes bacterium ADurb.Bin003]|nr:MAG: hypothetical protein BWX46_00519 [Candidatus Cloacimonetes bacterium ADurb.Bin003]